MSLGGRHVTLANLALATEGKTSWCSSSLAQSVRACNRICDRGGTGASRPRRVSGWNTWLTFALSPLAPNEALTKPQAMRKGTF
jgi:hypothetical protein